MDLGHDRVCPARVGERPCVGWRLASARSKTVLWVEAGWLLHFYEHIRILAISTVASAPFIEPG